MDWLWVMLLVAGAVAIATVLSLINEKSERELAEIEAEHEEQEWAALDEEDDDDQYWHPDRDAAYPIHQWWEPGDDDNDAKAVPFEKAEGDDRLTRDMDAMWGRDE